MFLLSVYRIRFAGVALMVLAISMAAIPLRADDLATESTYLAMRADTPAPIRVGAGDRIEGVRVQQAIAPQADAPRRCSPGRCSPGAECRS